MYDLINLIAYAAFMLTLAWAVGYVGYYLAGYIRGLKKRPVEWDNVITNVTGKVISEIRKEKEWERNFKEKDLSSLFSLKNILEHQRDDFINHPIYGHPIDDQDRAFYDGTLSTFNNVLKEITILINKRS